MTRSILLCLILSLAVPALAQTGAGQVGNLNPPVGPSLPDIVTGDQGFAYLIQPAEQLSCEENGFRLEFVHMLLDFAPHQVPVTMQVGGGLLEAVWDDNSQSFVPGEELCAAQPQLIVVNDPGLFQVTVPILGDCGCRPIDDTYFLNIRYFSPLEADLPTDGMPAPGVVYWNNGPGWEDMIGVDKTATGKTIIWGDIICCTATVANEASTWGEVKSLFR